MAILYSEKSAIFNIQMISCLAQTKLKPISHRPITDNLWTSNREKQQRSEFNQRNQVYFVPKTIDRQKFTKNTQIAYLLWFSMVLTFQRQGSLGPLTIVPRNPKRFKSMEDYMLIEKLTAIYAKVAEVIAWVGMCQYSCRDL